MPPYLMPPKVRDLERQLKKAGFMKRAAKGSHRKWVHPHGAALVISGKASDDAKPYQEEEVDKAIAKAQG